MYTRYTCALARGWRRAYGREAALFAAAQVRVGSLYARRETHSVHVDKLAADMLYQICPAVAGERPIKSIGRPAGCAPREEKRYRDRVDRKCNTHRGGGQSRGVAARPAWRDLPLRLVRRYEDLSFPAASRGRQRVFERRGLLFCEAVLSHRSI